MFAYYNTILFMHVCVYASIFLFVPQSLITVFCSNSLLCMHFTAPFDFFNTHKHNHTTYMCLHMIHIFISMYIILHNVLSSLYLHFSAYLADHRPI